VLTRVQFKAVISDLIWHILVTGEAGLICPEIRVGRAASKVIFPGATKNISMCIMLEVGSSVFV